MLVLFWFIPQKPFAFFKKHKWMLNTKPCLDVFFIHAHDQTGSFYLALFCVSFYLLRSIIDSLVSENKWMSELCVFLFDFWSEKVTVFYVLYIVHWFMDWGNTKAVQFSKEVLVSGVTFDITIRITTILQDIIHF